MNCGRRWDKAARWLREGPRERKGRFVARRCLAAPRRNDLPAVYRTATGPRESARGFLAHPGVWRVPDVAARAGARVAPAYTRDAGGRGGAAREAGAVSRARAEVHAMDLDCSFRVGGNRSLRALYRICRALATATGAGRLWRVQSFEFADISGRLVERMAINDHFVGNSSVGNAGRICRGLPAQAGPAGFGAGNR